MSWQSFRLVCAYTVPVLIVVAVTAWRPTRGVMAGAAVAVVAVTCQALLLNAHIGAQRSARLDPLTGLPGRAFLVDRMRRALAGSAEGSLVFVDLDCFKAVNDTYGHVTGDQVLIETARRLCELAPESAVVARYGGDEFAVFFPTGPAVLDAVARRIEATLQRPISLADTAAASHITISASVGWARARSVGASVDEMLAAADRVMYQAKRAATGMRTAVPNGEAALPLP
jgi:diguanylate cyclase